MDTRGLTGAEALLRLLREMGVERIFASPGSEWSPVWEHIAKPYGSAEEIPVYLSSRHEEVAVAMASGYAKASGKLPAVMIHTTVGSLHATMALRGALHQRVPMVVLAGESIGFGEAPGPDPGRQWVLLADMGGPARLVERCVKWSFGLNSIALLPATVQRACQLAMAAPEGPTFVSVPMEFLLDTLPSAPPPSASLPRAGAANPEAIDELAHILTEAASPLIVTEEVGRSARAVDHLVALAELLGAPVVEGWSPGYVNFPRTHPLYGGSGPPGHIASYLKECDVVFLLAALAPWHPPSSAPGSGTKVVILDDEPLHSQIPFWGYRADLMVTGEVEHSLAMLLERVRRTIRPHARASNSERWRARHEKTREALRAEGRASGSRKTIETRWVAHELNEVLPDDAVVVDETITHRLDILRYLDRLTPGRFFEASHGGLGTGLGEALGVKAAAPNRTVIALIGDGALNYNPVLAAFGASQEHRLPILIVIFNNSGYLSQKAGIPLHYPDGWAVKSKRFVGTSIAPSPDYAAVAQAFGGYGEKVTDPRQVRAALQRGLEAVSNGRIALVDMTLEPINPGGEG
jgi:acetolactate synthase I/II/III large subunit